MPLDFTEVIRIIMVSWEILLVLLCLYTSAFSLHIYRQRDSESKGIKFLCCVLDRVECNGEDDVNTSRWLKDDEEYREMQGNSLELSEFQDEGYWSCSLKFANGSVTDWSNAEEVCLSMNVRSEPQQKILVNARLERIQYKYKLSIGKLSHKQKINHIFLYTIGNGSQTYLLAETLRPNYLLTERISNNGNFLFLSNFSVILNWTEVQSSFINNSLKIILEIRLKQTRSSINSTTIVTLDCKRKKEHAIDTFLLTFTKGTECAEYEDSQVIKYLLAHTTCLMSDFNVTVLCSNINPQTGILKISSLWTIQLRSVQAALETVAMVNLSNINNSFIESPMATTFSDMKINTSSRKLFIAMICLLSFSITLLLCLASLILKKSIKKTKTRRSSLARCENTSHLREVSTSPELEEAEQEEHDGLRGPLINEDKTKRWRFTATGREADAVEIEQKMTNTLEESKFGHFNQMMENNHLQDNLTFEELIPAASHTTPHLDQQD